MVYCLLFNQISRFKKIVICFGYTLKMLVNFTFIGLMAPVFTIFNPDYSINIERIPKYASYLLESGITGVLVGATTGEGTSLSVQERKTLTEAWSEAVKTTHQHLMIHVGGAPFPDVLELTKHASDVGVDSILSMPELYFKPKNSQELITYLKFISAAAPNTPLFYYHNPGHTAVHIDMADFLKHAAEQIPNLRGIKYTSNDLNGAFNAWEAGGDKNTIFIGGDMVLGPSFALGFTSAIAGSMNPFPRYSVGMLAAIKESNVGKAAQLQQNLTRAINILAKYGSKVSGMKLAMNLFSPINVGLARPPLQNVSPSRIQEIKQQVEPFLY